MQQSDLPLYDSFCTSLDYMNLQVWVTVLSLKAESDHCKIQVNSDFLEIFQQLTLCSNNNTKIRILL